MSTYRHYVSGFFASREEAEKTMSQLLDLKFSRRQLQLYEAKAAPSPLAPPSDSNETLKNVIFDGAIGTAIGTGIGALAEIALIAANVSLFVASPLIAPLAMLGWGAGVGGFLGAAAGASADTSIKKGQLADLVADAVASGQIVLVAEAHTEFETIAAREVIETAVGEYQDVATA